MIPTVSERDGLVRIEAEGCSPVDLDPRHARSRAISLVSSCDHQQGIGGDRVNPVLHLLPGQSMSVVDGYLYAGRLFAFACTLDALTVDLDESSDWITEPLIVPIAE